MRITSRFILDWNPTRQVATSDHGFASSDFVVPHAYAASVSHSTTVSAATAKATAFAHAVDGPAVDTVPNSHATDSHAAAAQADLSALHTLVFAAAPAQHESTADVAPASPPIVEHAMIHIDALSYGPSLVSSMAPHAYLAPVGLTAPRLMDDFQ